MQRILIAALALVSLSGCVSVPHRPLTAEASDALNGGAVTATRYPRADFAAMTAGKATLGLIGGMAMVSAGNKIVEENDIADPAVAISAGLLEKLAAERHMQVVTNNDTVANSDKLPELLASYDGVRYLLDVKTMNWLFSYYPNNWDHYRLIYSAHLRLIDAADRSVVAESTCQSVQGDDNNPPTKDQLLDNHAALLKSYVQQAASACVEVLSRDVLHL